MRKKPQPKPVAVQEGTLIGHAGKKPVYIANEAKHVFVCGTTGSGKTVALSNFIKNAIDNNLPALIIDGKGDIGNGSILDMVKKLNTKGKKLYVINLSDPEQSDHYNPFTGATATIAKDMLINMTDWSEEHYKLNAERYIQRIVQLLCMANQKLSFKLIIRFISTEKFEELSAYLLKIERISKEEHLENMEIAKTSGKIAQSSTARFATIAESEVNAIFSEDGIDIATAMQENAIILFVLNPLIYPELSPNFGRLILIDAKKAIGTLFKMNQRTFFILDEINSYASTTLTDLVNKSRSAGVTCVLSTQSLSDLDFACGEAFKEQIIENCNNYLVMRQNSSVNSENWAKILGTKNTMEMTYQLQQKGLDTAETGFGSARRVREFFYHPDDIKTLGVGKGIFLSKDTNYHSRIQVLKPVSEEICYVAENS